MKNKINSSFFHIILVKNSQRGKELNQFCPPNSSDDIAFSSVLILRVNSWTRWIWLEDSDQSTWPSDFSASRVKHLRKLGDNSATLTASERMDRVHRQRRHRLSDEWKMGMYEYCTVGQAANGAGGEQRCKMVQAVGRATKWCKRWAGLQDSAGGGQSCKLVQEVGTAVN